MSTARKCPCGDSVCTAWLVKPEAAVQGVRFTKQQAEIVASVLSGTAVVIACDDRTDAVSTASAVNYFTPHINTATVIGEEPMTDIDWVAEMGALDASLPERLVKLATRAETSKTYVQEFRMMRAEGVADLIWEAHDEILRLRALNENQEDTDQ